MNINLFSSFSTVSPNRILIRNLVPYDKGITVIWDSDRMDLLVNLFITVEQQASSGTESLIYNISDLMAKENCVGGLKLETNYKVCVNATYRDLGDMQQQDCNFTTTLSQLDLMNNGVQCILFDTNSTTPTTTPQRSRMYTFSSFSSLGTRPSHAGEEGGCLRIWF